MQNLDIKRQQQQTKKGWQISHLSLQISVPGSGRLVLPEPVLEVISDLCRGSSADLGEGEGDGVGSIVLNLRIRGLMAPAEICRSHRRSRLSIAEVAVVEVDEKRLPRTRTAVGAGGVGELLIATIAGYGSGDPTTIEQREEACRHYCSSAAAVDDAGGCPAGEGGVADLVEDGLHEGLGIADATPGHRL
ncbi:hypothetical protein B296_00004808 [Ensete ventricosum]|uniref:Uncharacterized protein n=1 Tax=Ensete ventricosum TaxID=4639 RepID=A0A427A609_ENSVE|nr:hypothetical protein B296_00004808 [Ensete ventricosum]